MFSAETTSHEFLLNITHGRAPTPKNRDANLTIWTIFFSKGNTVWDHFHQLLICYVRVYPYRAKAKSKATRHFEGIHEFIPGKPHQVKAKAKVKAKTIFAPMGPGASKSDVKATSLSLVWVDLKGQRRPKAKAKATSLSLSLLVWVTTV